MPAAPRVHASCQECGAPLAASARRAGFCCQACRHSFNNRRATRGRVLYDLYMAHRFDRETATAMGVLAFMNRLASEFREEDKARNAGRRSWRAPADVLADRPSLRSSRGMI